jgi:site-specific recombinase XerD
MNAIDCRAAGVHKRIHAHGLRHLFATELQAEGAPLSMIRDLLGHSSLATTDTYLRRLGARGGGRLCPSAQLGSR